MRGKANRSVPQWRLSFMFCVGTATSTLVFAQTPLTIDSAVDLALTQNASMAQTRAAAAGKQEDLRAAKRINRPTLGFEMTVLRGSGKPTSFSAVNTQYDPDAPVIEPITGDYGAGTLALKVPIFQNGALFFRESPAEDMANGSLLKAQSDVDTQAVDLSNQVAKIYLNALSAAEQLLLQQSAVEKLQHRLDIVRVRVRAGLGSFADELGVKAALAEKNSDLNAARRNSALQLMQLALSLGQEQNLHNEITPVSADFPSAPILNDVLKGSLETHPALRSQMANVRVTKSLLDAQRAESMPKLIFDVSRTEAGNFYHNESFVFTSAGFKLTMPLLDFGQVSAKVRARGHEVEESEQKALLIRNTLTQNAYQAYYAYQDAVDKVEAGNAALAKAEFQEKESTAKREKGLVGFDTLLQDEASALAARVSQVKLRYEAWVAWADFVKSIGRPFRSNLVASAS